MADRATHKAEQAQGEQRKSQAEQREGRLESTEQQTRVERRNYPAIAVLQGSHEAGD